LTDEPKSLFETYVKQNYAKELENPLFSAEKLWKDSAAVANGDAAAGPNSVCSMTVNLPTSLA
jgi:hypothetical protein